AYRRSSPRLCAPAGGPPASRISPLVSAVAAGSDALAIADPLACQRRRPPVRYASDSKGGPAMIRISVLYPSSEGKKFDVNYYVNNHMKLVRERLGSFGLVRTEVDKGLAGGAPGAPAP